ncbi:lysosomal acid lipase/cholesteryl ester hydrolase-like [Periplaneta americana]|uniref:lysosomal acid lipase/cholesteryl ester hydrolase-like n=1 Tax=Periplaneta americana TaxID=6978 RepID=UPI0037E7DE30
MQLAGFVLLMFIGRPASAGLASLLAGGESEAFMTTPEVIRKYGYPAEEHTVETKDGYVLKHFRIPGGRTNSNAGRPAVILQHRLLMTSSAWIFLGQEGSLAFNLADAGYDVWLTNSRGNRYSRKHVTLSPDTEKFWDFSWHEMGMYDLPATVDYILNITGNKQLYYVGHSIGSSIFSVMTSKLPEYNQKISLNVGLAPAIYVGNPTGLELRTLVLFRNIMAVLFKTLRLWEILPYSRLRSAWLAYVCSKGPLFYLLCLPSYKINFGSYKYANKTQLPVFVANLYSGTSLKNILHTFQIISTGKFSEFDYGSAKNMEVYGQSEAPDYNLKNISVPTSLYYSKGDIIINSESVQKLATVLPHIIGMNDAFPPEFGHVDFIIASEAKPLVYDKILNDMKLY